jgi:streptomycin 6-kinase
VAVQGSYRPYAMGWHTGAFASGAGNNEGILMVWRYAYTGPSAAWAHGEAPAWT